MQITGLYEEVELQKEKGNLLISKQTSNKNLNTSTETAFSLFNMFNLYVKQFDQLWLTCFILQAPRLQRFKRAMTTDRLMARLHLHNPKLN